MVRCINELFTVAAGMLPFDEGGGRGTARSGTGTRRGR
jgi:hypothetical protein